MRPATFCFVAGFCQGVEQNRFDTHGFLKKREAYDVQAKWPFVNEKGRLVCIARNIDEVLAVRQRRTRESTFLADGAKLAWFVLIKFLKKCGF